MNSNKVYVMIDALKWPQDRINYRRHRLARFLARQTDTNLVLWVYPVSASPRKHGSYQEAKEKLKNNFYPAAGEEKIVECALPDFVPGRYMLFKSGLANPVLNELKEYLQKTRAKKILLFTYPAFPYLDGLIKWDRIIYDCSDLWQEPSGGSRSNTFSAKLAGRLIASAENRIVKKSDFVFASSVYLAENIRARTGRQVITVENGVDLAYLNEIVPVRSDDLNHLPRPRLGYIGAMRSKIDFELLYELALSNPGWSIVLVGPDCLNRKETFNQLLGLDNVYWTGEIKPELIPAYIRNLDVGLLPYKESTYNKAVFPIKFYEYLSQGIPVVGCGVPSTAQYSQEKIYLHVQREEFKAACQKALSWPADNQDTFTKMSRINLARGGSWEKKLSFMAGKIKDSL